MRGPTRNARITLLGLAVALSGVGWGTRGARGQDLGQQPQQQPPPPPAPHTPTVTKPPAVLKAVEAIYPQEALAERLSADVTMLIEIDATGKVTKTEITQPAGHGFDEAAAAAVAQYQFSPAEIDGKPSPIRIAYTLHFVPNVVPDAGPPEAPPPPPPPPPPPLQVVAASGRLREKGTREPLPAADVAIIVRNADGSDAPAEIVGVTDLDGRFEVKAPAGRALRVVITDVAHDPCIRDLVAGSEAAPMTIDCIVARRPGVGQETVVKAPPPTQAVTRYELKQPELTSVPGTFGDPLRVVQSLPGVARTPYGLGALIIRGASPDDSGIYVEGHPIPILYHFLIGPSVMTPRLIERIDFFPGNFGVQYGRATAGIVDVGLKTDRTPRVHGVADLNLLDSSAYVEGPLGKEWSGSISARRSYVDLVLKALAPSDTTLVAPAYYDYQASARRNLGNGRLSLFAFGSDDTLKVISTDPNRGDIELNTAIGFHKLIAAWVAGVGAGWVNKLSPAVGYERLRFGAGAVEVNQSAYVAELRDELSRALTPALTFRVGFDGVMRREHLFFNLPVPPMARLWGETIPMFQERTIPLDSLGAGLYSDVAWDLGRGVTVIPGLRGDLFRVVDQNRFTFDPRLVVRWKMRPTHTWKAGAGIYHQMPQAQLMTPEYGNPNLPPIWADQYSVGFVNNLTKKLSLDTTFYYVRRHDLPVPPPPFTANGQGRSYGMELILKHEFTDRFFGWLSYTLSRSEQTAYAVNTPMLSGPGLQDPNARPMTWFPTDFDQTHNLIIVGSYKLGAWQLGGRFRLVTGAPDTPMREGAFDADTGRYACATAPINSARKPTFHQLDVRAERLWTFTAWQLGAYVDIQNVLNAENPEATIYDYRCRGTTALRGIPFFPIFGIRGLF